MVVGPYFDHLQKSLIFVDTLGATSLTVADTGDGLVEESDLTAAANPKAASSLEMPEFALLIGVRWAGDDVLFEVPGPGFSLVRLPGARTIDFTQASWFGLLSVRKGYLALMGRADGLPERRCGSNSCRRCLRRSPFICEGGPSDPT